jgi:E3 ubiquitin-protein ligase DOA10
VGFTIYPPEFDLHLLLLIAFCLAFVRILRPELLNFSKSIHSLAAHYFTVPSILLLYNFYIVIYYVLQLRLLQF